ncbi:phosphoadenosine phosphosulfate reductase [Pyrolobus fumarii 1A]|uniref:Phosphoadenosine phosphosulfate reductase n=1 Tax=Pyrolobus fumarii (strain DSM 11204 / 1A) TaxID=694429 RepID=G0EFF9_PYRF1|nr:phosphoadenosine phosphosulfate reductase family protein [Pyrolobus fumarii]AEM38983.1 phosphoadenosine phosphosulfate reductase [Pyrolobus fumarii 1A]
MSEALPVFEAGRLTGFVASSADFTVYGRVGSGRRLYLWSGGAAGPVEWRVYEVEGFRVEPSVWAVYAPLEAWRRLGSLEGLVSWLAREAGHRLQGKKLLLSFSGGKDSTAALIVLDALYEKIDFKLEVVHVHMPYLEPEYHVDEALRLASRLGYNVEVIEPPRRVLARRLLEEGLPWRRARWCTYYKTRPLEEHFERIQADYMVVGDRIGESLMRSKRLRADTLFERNRFEPIKHLTLIDVVLLVRSLGLTHRDYQAGLTRVSCRYCPYKSLAEMLIDERLGGDEDPGLIEEVLRREWRRWYHDIPLEEFLSEHYWRYTPRVARAFHRLKRLLKPEPELDARRAAELHSSVWTTPIEALESLPLLEPPEWRL